MDVDLGCGIHLLEIWEGILRAYQSVSKNLLDSRCVVDAYVDLCLG